MLSPSEIKQYCSIGDEGHRLLEQAVNRLGLSHRAYHRILKLGRTIADLDDSASILVKHLSEATSYRWMGRQNY